MKVQPEHAAEILDTAINAGATSSGQIEWTVKDEKALEAEALDKAAARAKANAEVLAKGMGVRLGSLIYVSNQMSTPSFPRPMPMMAMKAANAPPSPSRSNRTRSAEKRPSTRYSQLTESAHS